MIEGRIGCFLPYEHFELHFLRLLQFPGDSCCHAPSQAFRLSAAAATLLGCCDALGQFLLAAAILVLIVYFYDAHLRTIGPSGERQLLRYQCQTNFVLSST